MVDLNIEVLNHDYSIHKLSFNSEIPIEILNSDFYTVSKTSDELSVVCESRIEIKSLEEEPGWRCIKVLGPLDFNLTGILAKISNTLEKEEISLFAISTYDTDYVLVKKDKLGDSLNALRMAGINEYK
jgi:hypothetical protein